MRRREDPRSKRRDRELERTHRLLRRVDLEEVLDELGLEPLHFKGADAYIECPDPEHVDENPSCHVCVEDVEDERGRSRLGAFNCWSHPGEGFRGKNFLDLVARHLFEIWGESEDGDERWPREEDRDRAAAWIRTVFLGRDGDALERRREEVAARRARDRKRKGVSEELELIWPPCRPVAEADPRCQIYLSKRGITPGRALELDVRGVRHSGDALSKTLRSLPGVLFPIRWEGKVISWYVRSILRNASKSDKGRYAPKVRIAKAGAIWLPDEVDFRRPLVLVEGIFDSESVRRFIIDEDLDLHPGNVGAVLGGRLTPEQARRIRAFSRIIHVSDGDDGGRTLTESIEEQLEDHTIVDPRPLPEGIDPDDAPRDALLRALRVPEERSRVTRRYRRSRRTK